MNDWERKWEEYCEVLNEHAKDSALLAYMDKVEKRLAAASFLEGSGSVEYRKSLFLASEEYKEFTRDWKAVNDRVQAQRARRDQLQAWFDLYRTDESTRREEMRLAR